MTHTFAVMELSAAAYDEVAANMKEAGYDHAFMDEGIDMHGIGVARGPDSGSVPSSTHHARVDELLEANNRYLERARKAEAQLKAALGRIRIRTGDVVLHGPSGEEWSVAYADYETGKLAAGGWPDGEADISDCTLVHAATDEEFMDVLSSLAVSGDRRGKVATQIAARDMGKRQ